jgi:hypothetical protein
VAEELVGGMEFRPFAATILEGVCFAFANRVSSVLPRNARPWRRLIRFMNHAYVLRITNPQSGRAIYSRLEPLLHWDYHYWLQRGSLEVEVGDLDFATQFLDQARSLMPDNRMIETEYGYLLMKKAIRNPAGPQAKALFEEGVALLEDLIVHHGHETPYPYHVLGSQGLNWTRHAKLTRIEKRSLLERSLSVVRDGLKHYPFHRDLKTLVEELQREWMSTAVAETE